MTTKKKIVTALTGILSMLAMFFVAVSPSQGAEVSKPLLGVGGGNADPAYLEGSSPGGNLGLRRSYYHLPGGTNSAINAIKEDQAKGRVSWVSFKLDGCTWAQIKTGCADEMVKNLNTELLKLDQSKPVWVIFHHEPEGDDVAADFPGMQDRILPLLTAPSVKKWIVVTGWHEIFGTSSFEEWWPKTAKVDGIGIDPYNWYGTDMSTNWNELEKFFTPTKAFADSKGVSWGVAEFGIDHDGYNSTANDGQHWIERQYTKAAQMGAAGMAYFDSNLHSAGNSDWRLSTLAGKKESFLRALALSKGTSAPTAAASPAPTSTPTVSASPAPTTTSTASPAPTTTSTASPAPTTTPTGTPTATTDPYGPTGLRAANVLQHQLDLYWNAVPGATSYRVYRNGAVVETSSNAHELMAGLQADSNYTFRVGALVGGVWHDSALLTVKTKA